MFKKLTGVLLLFLFTGTLSGFSQEIKPTGTFLEDSVSIGKSIPYSLSVRYPKNMDVVFPDSLFDFSPYELDDKIYYPTQSDNTSSFDSAVYYLTSFEIDTVQYLALPVFILQAGDSVEILPNRDSVILKQRVTEIPDSVAAEAMPLIENTTYKRVNIQFNYPYFLIGLGILIVIAVAVLVIFGGRIRRYFRLRRMQKVYTTYESYFEDLLKKTNSVEDVERLLAHWKKYLEKLEREPFTKLTTKEILTLHHSETIETALKGIDRTIYAAQDATGAVESFNRLKDYALERYELKVEEVKNA
ncbi:MAG: hypothetical protein AAFN93_16280 [Bacteroidota bacterium]